MEPKRTGVTIASKIPESLMTFVQKAVNIGDFLTLSDFVRHAVKEKLERDGYRSAQ